MVSSVASGNYRFVSGIVSSSFSNYGDIRRSNRRKSCSSVAICTRDLGAISSTMRFAFVAIGAWTAPREHFKTAIVLCGIWLALALLSLLVVTRVIPFPYSLNEIQPSYGRFCFSAIGALLGLWIAHFKSSEWAASL